MRKIIVMIAISTVAASGNAADKKKIRAWNVSLQPVFTILSAAIQGHLQTFGDVSRCTLVGAAAGYGFYEAKVTAGRHRVGTGWALGNLATSMTSNAAAGRNPLDRIGWSIGPLRFEMSTFFEKNPSALIHVGASLVEAVSLVKQWSNSDNIHFRSGMITFTRNSYYHERHTDFDGVTSGIFPGVVVGSTPDVFPHESIHALQALQMDSVEPPLWTWQPPRRRLAKNDYVIIRFDRFDEGFVQLGESVAFRNIAYERDWTEIEAYRLAENTAPPRLP